MEPPPPVVRLEPVTAAWADALAVGDDAFTSRFGVPVEPGWTGFPEVIGFLVAATRGDVAPEWGPHLIFDADGALVGNAGWKGPPVDGTAELGYSVAPARQGRGIATATVRELLSRARAAGVDTVVAHTLPGTSASTSVLERCGFVRVTEEVDPDDGPVSRWECRLGQPPSGSSTRPSSSSGKPGL